MRIAIVNDVPVAAEVLRRVVSLQKAHEIAWVATDGADALQACLKDTPDLILMDLIMPKMNGVQATREIMKQCPCAILIVTISVQENTKMVFEAMGAGALDAVDTPALGVADFQSVSTPLLAKINSLQGLLGFKDSPKPQPASTPQAPLVVIGASAGGPAALAEILRSLPKNFPSPVIVVQHVDEQFAPSLVGWLKNQCVLPIRGACNGDSPVAGEVLVAIKDEHLVFTNTRKLMYAAEPKETFYWPSVDVFFESVARHWRGKAIGVLLTGMGRDGAKGLKAMRDAGCHTIAQDKASCAVYGMPKAAIELGAVVEILPVNAIAAALAKRCTSN